MSKINISHLNNDNKINNLNYNNDDVNSISILDNLTNEDINFLNINNISTIVEKLEHDSINNTHNITNDRNIVFRNYTPIDQNLKVLPYAHFKQISKIEKEVGKRTRKYIKNFTNLDKNTLSIIPEDHAIDLKRMLSNKLNILNKKTELAIGEMLLAKKGIDVNTLKLKSDTV